MTGPSLRDILKSVQKPDASRVRPPRMPDPLNTIGPRRRENDRFSRTLPTPRNPMDIHGDVRDILAPGRAGGMGELLQWLPGTGEAMGLEAGTNLAREGHRKTGALVSAMSILPGGKVVGKRLGKMLSHVEGSAVDDVVRKALANPGGATINPVTGELATKGYAVGGLTKSSVVRELTPDVIRKVLADVPPGAHLGIWKDGNKWHVEGTEVLPNFNDAVQRGVDRKQLAIGNLEKYAAGQNGDVTLLKHRTTWDDLKSLNPKYMGTGQPGAERARPGRPNALHYYTMNTPHERQFSGSGVNEYYTAVHGDKLADLSNPSPEVRKIMDRSTGHDDMERRLFRAGYHIENRADYPGVIKSGQKLPVFTRTPKGKAGMLANERGALGVDPVLTNMRQTGDKTAFEFDVGGKLVTVFGKPENGVFRADFIGSDVGPGGVGIGALRRIKETVNGMTGTKGLSGNHMGGRAQGEMITSDVAGAIPVQGGPTMMAGMAGAGAGAAAGASVDPNHPLEGAVAGGVAGGVLGARGALAVERRGARRAPETVREAALHVPGEGTFTGRTHFDAVKEMQRKGLDIGKFAPEEGFVTSTGRFVSREEALQLAGRADQLGPGAVGAGGKLDATDIKGFATALPRNTAGTLGRRGNQLAQYLTVPEEAALATKAGMRNFDATANALPDPETLVHGAVAGGPKKGWYENSVRALQDTFGEDAPRFAALLAAGSPQTSVPNNLSNTVTMWEVWNKAGRPTDPKKLKRLVANALPGDVLPEWINNSVRALTHPNPAELQLSGPKVNAFMKNLQGDPNAVTLDTWMAKIANIPQSAFRGKAPTTKAAKLAGAPSGVSAPYAAYSGQLRQVAPLLQERTGVPWSPANTQETLWSFAKGVEDKASRGLFGNKTPTEAQMSDAMWALSPEEIRATPDFSTLLQGHAAPLTRMGLPLPRQAPVPPLYGGFGRMDPAELQKIVRNISLYNAR